jgi:hypothetical protein
LATKKEKTMAGDHADSGWDDYAERVLRNEGRLDGLQQLVAETRATDNKLITQRSDSLATELERRAEALLELVTARADAVLSLSREERDADRREVELLVGALKEKGEAEQALLREMYDRMIRTNYEQSQALIEENADRANDALHQLELRRQAATEKVEQMVRQWRESDKEARDLFAKDLARHLDQLNHANERITAFQANSVTRELWQSEKDASVAREGLLRDQIIQLDRQMLTMTPLATAEKAHTEMLARMEANIQSAATVLDNKITVVTDKVGELREQRRETVGKSAGYSAFIGWIVAGLSILISVVILANAFISK